MPARTSTQAGNLDDGATWVGGVAPVEGDTPITINHLVVATASAELGSSGASSTIDIIVNAGGELFINSGVVLRVNGRIQPANGVVTMDPLGGAVIEFGNGGSGQGYGFSFSSATGQTSSRLVSLAPLATPNIVRKEAGAGDWTIQRTSASNLSYFSGLSCANTDFYDGGGTAFSDGNIGIDINPSGALQEARLDHCRLIRTSLKVAGCPANRNISIDIKLEQPKNAPGATLNVFITASHATTGERKLDVVGRHSYLALSGSREDYVSRWIICARFADSATMTGGPAASIGTLLLLPRVAGAASAFGVPGETTDNIGGFLDSGVISSYVLTGPTPSGTGTITYDRVVLGGTAPWEEDDYFFPPAPASGGPYRYDIKRALMLLNSRGLPAGNIVSSHGSSLTQWSATQCTGGVMDNQGPSGRAWFMLNVGADLRGFPGMIPASHSHLVYAPAPLANPGGWMQLCYSGSPVALTPLSNAGTAAGTSTATRIVCTGKTWPTAGKQKFLDAQAWAVITVNAFGTGPPVGEWRPISDNGADWFEVAAGTPWSAVPNNGTQFRIHVTDIITEGMSGYSVTWNVKSGTNYQADGITTFSAHGFEGFTVSNPAALVAGMRNLGTGSNMVTAGPKFFDHTRHYVNWASRYAGPAGLLSTPADWATGQVLALDDRRKTNVAGWFASEVLWYRCVVPHTSAAADKPGSGANWRTYWELDYGGAVSDLVWAGTQIDDPSLWLVDTDAATHSLDWIRRGWAPRNRAVIGAGLGGLDAGAVPWYGAHGQGSATSAFSATGASTVRYPRYPAAGAATSAYSATGSCSIRAVRVAVAGTATMAFSATGASLVRDPTPPTVLGLTGVSSLIRAVKTDRPLLLRIDPATPVLGRISASGAATSRYSATGTSSIRAARVSGAGAATSVYSATGASSIRSHILMSGSATLAFSATGASTVRAMRIAGAGSATSIFSATGASLIRSAYSADIATLIGTELGGDAAVTAFCDYRHGKTTVTGVSNWADARGASGFGPALAQATTTKQPLDDGTTINFDSADDILVSAAIAALSLDTSRSIALIAACVSPASRFALVIRNAGATRNISLFHNASSQIAARVIDSAGTYDQTTNVALSANIRCSIAKEQAPTRQMKTRCFNSAEVERLPAPTGTVAVENCLISLGGFNNSLFALMKVRAVIVSAGGTYWTSGQQDAIRDWAVANHGSVNA